MKKPTREEIREMARHPEAAIFVLAIDILILPLHLAFILTDKIQRKWKKNRKDSQC